MNTYCEHCKCWHRPDGSKADGPENETVPEEPKKKTKARAPKTDS